MNKLYRIRVESIGDTILTFMLVTDKQYNIESKIKYKNKEWVVKSCEEFVVTSDEIQVVEENKSTWFTPKKNERYHFIEFGEVREYTYSLTQADIDICSSQKVFKTRSEAEKQLLKQQATIRVKKRIAELNDGWLPNWNNKTIGKYFIEYYYREAKLCIGRYTQYKHTDNDLYLESGTLAKQLIEEMESDLKLMLEVE